MKYVVLVSHGTFAPGLKSVLAMLAGGEREDVIRSNSTAITSTRWAPRPRNAGCVSVSIITPKSSKSAKER